MSDRASKDISQELAFLATLERTNAEIDTSGIPEIENWSGAVTGKFYRAAQMPTLQLVAECVSAMSEDTWQEFIRRTQPLISRAVATALRRSGDASPELVSDLVQEVYLRLCANDFKALRNFDLGHDDALFGFLKVLAANIVSDHVRKASVRGSLDSVEYLSAPEARKSAGELENRLLMGEVDQILQRFSKEPGFERDHKIFWLYYKDGFTAQEISQLPGIGLTAKGIESILHRLKNQIRSSFREKHQRVKKKR